MKSVEIMEAADGTARANFRCFVAMRLKFVRTSAVFALLLAASFPASVIQAHYGESTRTYEPDRDLIASHTTAAGETIRYTHDDDGHPATLTYPGGATLACTHDGNGRPVRLVDWAGRTTFR